MLALVAVEKGDEFVDEALTDCSVARSAVIVERMVHLQIELLLHVVRALQDELSNHGLLSCLGLCSQPREQLVHNERRFVCALVAQYVVLEVAYDRRSGRLRALVNRLKQKHTTYIFSLMFK